MDAKNASALFAQPNCEISDENLQKRLDYLNYSANDDVLLARAWTHLEQGPQGHINAFYQHVSSFAETGAYISQPGQTERLHKMQQRYLHDLFCAPIDAEYVQNRLRIGQVHHHIGLDPHWYLASCNQLLDQLSQSLEGPLDNDPLLYATTLRAATKRLFLDMGIVMNAYVASDRRELQRSSNSLRESQALLSEAHDLAQLARWELKLPDGPLNSCQRACEMLQLQPDPSGQITGYEQLRRWVHPLDRAEVDAAFQSTISSGLAYDVRYRLQHPGQPLKMLRERGRALHDNSHPVRVVGTVQDISLHISQLSRIEQLALFDDLTRLPNRANFLGHLDRRLAEASTCERTLSLLFIDLDEFKEINDTQGHSVGDDVLVEIALRLKACLREQEMVARLGGDEFVVIANGVDPLSAATIATRILENITQPMWIGQSHLSLRASIGISTYPRDGMSGELLLRNADTAMYAAKQNRNGIEIYRPEMSARLVRRVQLANRLKYVIAHGGLELYYQPQVALDDGRLIGAEALLRWNDDQLGRINPSEFVPLAEERGLISELGTWVVQQACRQLLQWDAELRVFPGLLALNISPRQFDDPGFAGKLIAQLHQAQVAPNRFDLELTESGIMLDPDGSLQTLVTLRDAGFTLSLDDFGMGYSSLTHLKGFPLDQIKLDRSFVSGMLEEPHDYAIVVATVAMAQSLGLKMVAEGVETAQQADALQRLGCGFAQGFYYGEPLPAERFAMRWMQRATATDQQEASYTTPSM